MREYQTKAQDTVHERFRSSLPTGATVGWMAKELRRDEGVSGRFLSRGGRKSET